jgi:hypothetical protein
MPQVRSEVRTAVFWDVTPCSLVGMCQRFGRIYCHYVKSKRVTMVATGFPPPKPCHLLTRLYGVTSRKTAVRTSNIICVTCHVHSSPPLVQLVDFTPLQNCFSNILFNIILAPTHRILEAFDEGLKFLILPCVLHVQHITFSLMQWMHNLSLASDGGCPGSVPGQVLWDLWWAEWQWGRFSESICFPCQFSSH